MAIAVLRAVQSFRNPFAPSAAPQAAPAEPGSEAAAEELRRRPADFWRELTDVDVWTERLLDFLPALGNAVVVLLAFWLVYGLTSRPAAAMLRRTRLQEALVELLVNTIYRWVLVVFAVIMAAAQLGINVTAALAGVSVVGIAIGLAAQDTLSNLIAGIVIFWDKPFRLGDWITSEGEHGRVAQINFRSTRIRTRQNKYVVVPNRKIVDSVIVNHSMYGEVRVDIPVGIAYKESVPQARRVLLEAMAAMETIQSGRSDVVVKELGPSSVDLHLRVWVDDSEKEARARFQCLEAAKLALDAAGIQIPYHHMQLFLERVEPPAADALKQAFSS